MQFTLLKLNFTRFLLLIALSVAFVVRLIADMPTRLLTSLSTREIFAIFIIAKYKSRKNHITLLPFGAMIVLSHRGFLKPSGCMPGKICNVICSIASLCMNFNDFASRGFFNSSIISRSHCVTAAMSVWEIEMRKKEDGKNWILPLWKYNWKTDRKFRFFFVCKKQLN